jgi:hypothetical protein
VFIAAPLFRQRQADGGSRQVKLLSFNWFSLSLHL